MDKINKWLNLGYDKETVQQCRRTMDKDNLAMLRTVSRLLIALLVVLVVFYTLFDQNTMRNMICIVSGLLVSVTYGISGYILKKEELCTPLRADCLIDALSALCLIVGIYLGTFAAGDNMAVAPIWMFFFITLVFNRMPVQNFWTIIISGFAFLICSYMTKSQEIFNYDIMHAFTSMLTAFIMSWSKSQMKVENILALEALKNKNMAIMETVEEQEKETELLRHWTERDELSGFFRKKAFEEEVKKILNDSEAGGFHALACCDIDNFKKINDSFGHLFGDDVLKEMVSVIKSELSLNCILGRFGGDEFMIFIKDVDSVISLHTQMERLVRKSTKIYCSNGVRVSISLSIGVAMYPGDGTTYKDLFEHADFALYEAKRQGKGICRLYKV